VLGLVNVGLRGVTMLGRFVLLLVMARYLEPAEVGLFALFSAASQWGVYLQGLEFSLFNLRELAAADAATRARRTRDAFALYTITFAFGSCVWAALFGGGLLPWTVFAWFLALLALEHATQEAFRLLNVFGRPLAASIVAFVRGGSWMYGVAIAMLAVPEARSLDVVFWAWLGGGLAAVVLSVGFLRALPWAGLPVVDWTWVRRGLGVALPLLAGTLALRGIAVFDRAYVGHVEGAAMLGVYGFYATIAGSIPVLADSGVGAVLYPKLMKAWQLGDHADYRVQLRRLVRSFAVLLAIVAPVAAGAVWLAGDYVRPEYGAHFEIFVPLLVAATALAASAVPQYALWARGKDRAMTTISIIGLVVVIVADLVLVPRHGALGAAWGQVVASVAMLALRVFALIRS
jgi:O-antigen/teichoic acid export membrane protein